MSDHKSLADQAVAALAAIKAMDDGMTLDHPERHAIRELKRSAEMTLVNAFREVSYLAMTVETIQDLGHLVKKETA